MRRIITFAIGMSLGFAIIASAIAATVLFGIGVGGHFLAVRDDGVAKVISFDPSTVAARAPFPAALALILTVCFIALYFELRRIDRRAKSGQR